MLGITRKPSSSTRPAGYLLGDVPVVANPFSSESFRAFRGFTGSGQQLRACGVDDSVQFGRKTLLNFDGLLGGD